VKGFMSNKESNSQYKCTVREASTLETVGNTSVLNYLFYYSGIYIQRDPIFSLL
jgi:hypothetical protein